MTTATINELAAGATRRRIGESVEIVGPGLNPRHVLVRRRGERRVTGLPTCWLDVEETGCRPRRLRTMRSVLG